MRFKKIMILTIILVSLLAVSSVSAAENVASDVVGADATDEVVSLDNNDQVITEGNVSEVGSFADLETEINNVEEGGVLNLTKDYKYVNGSTNGIQINKAITIDGHGRILDGNLSSRIFNITSDNVVLKNINFINGQIKDYGGAVYIKGNESLIYNCTFENNDAKRYGGAVYWESGNGNISNCSFVNNKGAVYWESGNGNISNCSFVNKGKWDDGRAVYWESVNGNIFDCSFVNNGNYDGGGAVYWKSGNGDIFDCSFLNNGGSIGFAVYRSGNGNIFDCSFVNNTGEDSGTVYWKSGNGDISNCSFVNNKGAVCWGSGNGNISNCSFVNNSQAVSGQSVNISNCCFVNNSQAIYWKSGNGNIFGCSFVNNGAYDNGGAVYWKSGNGNIFGCSFVNNTANIYGGAISINEGSVVNCTFINNKASASGGGYDSGGAININEGSVVNCTFINNSVGIECDGGAIFASSDVDIINCTFINNNATGGGAIKYGSAVNCTFINNSAINWGAGGAIYCGSAVNCIFINNNAINGLGGAIDSGSAVNCTFIGNFADSGGAIARSSASGCFFKDNKIDNIYDTIISSKFDTPTVKTYNLIASYGAPENIIIALENKKGEPIDNVSLSVNFNGLVSLITDSNGQISLTTDGLSADKYVATINFGGDDNYYPCNETVTITVLPLSSSLTIADVNSTVGHEIYLIANVNSSLTVNDGVVTFFDDGTQIGESPVSEGVASFTYTPTTAGEHNITAIFNSTNYLSSNSTGKLLVDSATIDVLVNQGIVGYNSSFVAEVKGLYSIVNEGNVTFYINDEYLGKVPVVKGSASISYVPLNANTYKVKALFGDSDKFLSDENNASYTVIPADTVVAIGDMNGTVGHDITITVGITSSNNLTINEGTVIFLDGSTQIGESPVSEGVATLTHTPTTAGEHVITAKYHGTNYENDTDSALLNVSKAEVILYIENIQTVFFSNPSNFAVNVSSNSKGVNEGNIKYYVNGKYIGMSNVYDGQSSTSFTTNITGAFDLFVVYNETDNYFARNASATFYVDKMLTTLSSETKFFDEEQSKTFTTELTDNNNNGVNNQIIKIEAIKYSGESRTFTGVSNSNGIAIYDVNDLSGGMWIIRGIYDGNNNYIGSTFTDRFIIIRMNTTTTIEEISNAQVNHSYKLKANIHDENGKLVKEGILQFYLDGVDIGSIDLSKNQGHQSALSKGVLGAVNPMFEYELGDGEDADLYIDYVPTKAGKYTLTAVYEGTTIYRASNQTTTFTVIEKLIPTEINTIEVQNNTYGENTIINVKTNASGVLTVKLNNANVKTFNIDANKLTALDLGKYDANNYDIDLSLDAGSNYTIATANAKFTVNPKQTTVELNVDNSIYGENVTVNVTASENGKVTIRLGGINKTIDVNANTLTSVDFCILDVGSYNITANFTAGNNYINSTATGNVKVLSKIKDEDINIEIPETISDKNSDIVINLPADATGTVTLTIGNNSYPFTVKDGVADIELPKLDDGKYDYEITYSGDSKYSSFTKTANLTVNNIVPTEITASGFNTVYNGDKYIIATLKDSNGNPLKYVKVSVTFLNGKTDTQTTNKYGQVQFSTNGLAPVQKYSATINFDGNANYEKSTTTVKVKVYRATPKIIAKAQKFKRSDKKKLYTIRLLTNQNIKMKYTKVYIKVNGKLYGAQTNKKGYATFKLTKLTNKGKYKAKIMYGGNSYYNALAIKVKLTVK